MPNYPRFCATRPGPAERSAIFAFSVCPDFQPLTILYAMFGRKGTPCVYLLLTNGTPFTYLNENAAFPLTAENTVFNTALKYE